MKRAAKFSIAADSPYTAEAGVLIAAKGGNAADIAVASALAATVCEVLMCSLGGSGFIVYRSSVGTTELIDGGDKVPEKIEIDPGQDDLEEAFIDYGQPTKLLKGYCSVAIPGILRALEMLWQRHGSLPWNTLVQPAIELASSGFKMGPTLSRWIRVIGQSLLKDDPTLEKAFFKSKDRLLEQGDVLYIENLAKSLQLIALHGAKEFYTGSLAERFGSDLNCASGYITEHDLANYQAMSTSTHDFDIDGLHYSTTVSPNMGGKKLELYLRLLAQNYAIGMKDAEISNLHYYCQDRLFQSDLAIDFHHVGGVEGLLDSINSSPNTTHISIVLDDGSAVSITMSMGYGSGRTISGTGIALNNSLGEQELNPAGYFKHLPGARLPSNMTPTIVAGPDNEVVAIGSPGATRIPGAIAQCLFNLHYLGKDLIDSVMSPRLHLDIFNGSHTLCHEPGVYVNSSFPNQFLRSYSQIDAFFGAVKVAIRKGDGRLSAYADRRREGAIAII